MQLYEAAGGREACVRLSEAFYSRVQRDPVLRPLFPGKSMRCAIEAFAAFLAQFLGGPTEDAQERWWLSLRESHARFAIGARERKAWMKHMNEALADVAMDDAMRVALREMFAQSSAYIANVEEPPPPQHREMAERWTEQRELDDLVAAVHSGDGERALELIGTPALRCKLARDRAVFAQVLTMMMARFQKYVEEQLRADPALVHIHHRYGRTLLHEAAAQGNLGVVELLLHLGADPNATTPGGQTPLYAVANQCQVPGGDKVVRALIRAGAQVDARSSQHATALHMAARRGNTAVAEALLACGADASARDKTGVTPLQRAKNCRQTEVAALLAR
jgi:hemoglobin